MLLRNLFNELPRLFPRTDCGVFHHSAGLKPPTLTHVHSIHEVRMYVCTYVYKLRKSRRRKVAKVIRRLHRTALYAIHDLQPGRPQLWLSSPSRAVSRTWVEEINFGIRGGFQPRLTGGTGVGVDSLWFSWKAVNCLVEGVMRQVVNRRLKQLQLQLRPWIVCFVVLALTTLDLIPSWDPLS